MIVRYYAPTEEYVKTERSKLSSDAAASQTDIVVNNADGFSADDYVCVGGDGYEKAELKQIDSIADSTITLKTNLSFAHDEDEVVVKFLYNQRKLYRSSTETGTYSVVSGATTSIEVDNPEGTLLEDSSGSSSYYYKSTYYNSTSSEETAKSDAIAIQGSGGTHYASLGDIREEAGFSDNYNVSDSVVDLYRSQAESKIKSAIATRYSLPLSVVPDLIEHLTIQLSAGYLLKKEYGEEAEGTTKDGNAKIELAEGILEQIRNGELTLLNADDEELATASTAYMSGFPDDDAGTDKTTQSTKDDPPIFEVGKEF